MAEKQNHIATLPLSPSESSNKSAVPSPIYNCDPVSTSRERGKMNYLFCIRVMCNISTVKPKMKKTSSNPQIRPGAETWGKANRTHVFIAHLKIRTAATKPVRTCDIWVNEWNEVQRTLCQIQHTQQALTISVPLDDQHLKHKPNRCWEPTNIDIPFFWPRNIHIGQEVYINSRLKPSQQRVLSARRGTEEIRPLFYPGYDYKLSFYSL